MKMAKNLRLQDPAVPRNHRSRTLWRRIAVLKERMPRHLFLRRDGKWLTDAAVANDSRAQRLSATFDAASPDSVK